VAASYLRLESNPLVHFSVKFLEVAEINERCKKKKEKNVLEWSKQAYENQPD
jgi:hypothetical protein